MPEHLSDLAICSRCGQTGSKKKCSHCCSISYCGEECQRKDWERHKDNCIPVVLTETTGKGRGLVASRDIPIGQVILKEQSVVSVYDDERNWSQRSSVAFEKSVRKVKGQVALLSTEKKSQFYKLSPNSEGDFQEMGRFCNNSTPDENSDPVAVHLFLHHCLMNHSCAPNAVSSLKSEKKKSRFKSSLYHMASNIGSSIFMFYLLEDWCILLKIFTCIIIVFIHFKMITIWARWRRAKKELVVRAIMNIKKGEEITICYLDPDQTLGSRHQMHLELKRKFLMDCLCSVCTGGNDC